MLKKIILFVFIILWIFTLFGCVNPASMQQTEPTENGKNLSASDVIRYPMLNGNDAQADFSAYYASGLDYPSQKRLVEAKQTGATKKFVVSNKEYVATYTKSRVYEDGENHFLKLGNYDEYDVKGKAEFHIFKDTGFLKFLYILEDECEVADKIVTDFSEVGLRSAADAVLQNLYGLGINEYLNSYYQFEFGKLLEYANSELNRYVVCYRAYLNGYPTDDIIYVQFSLRGALMSVSAQRYLQYQDMDTTTLIAVDKLEEVIRNSASKLDYTSIGLYERENDVACYYTMNAKGELYYVMKWKAFKSYNEDTGSTFLETLAVRAS